MAKSFFGSMFRTMLALAVIGPIARGDDASSGTDDLARVVEMIDAKIAQGWQAADVAPTDRADDSEYLRRVSLDIVGRIPTAMEVREFLADESPDKRRRLVDRLVDDPRYALHFSHFWRSVLIPEVDTDFNVMYLTPGFEAWLRTKLLSNDSYQSMVREILSVDVSGNNMYRYDVPQPVAYYASKEVKPENLAAATSRMFLGVRIECAQCHDHPFDHWTRRDFWGYSAFFSGLERTEPGPGGLVASLREFFGQHKVRIPDTDEFVEPTYLDHRAMERGQSLTPRQALTEWIVADSNPYFARMAVNRMWGHFCGVGFVDPIDDFSSGNPPSHPELLDELAREFIAQKYDLKFLIRAITLSQAYQLSSRQTDSRQSDPRLFACMAIKGLSAEQIYDNLIQATGKTAPFVIESPVVYRDQTPRGRINELFSDVGGKPTERPTTILQSLAFMNGELVHEATQVDRSQLLGAITEFPGFTTSDQIEVLFLTALGRLPTEIETRELTQFVEQKSSVADRQKALGDVFWAVLNSSEFLYNH